MVRTFRVPMANQPKVMKENCLPKCLRTNHGLRLWVESAENRRFRSWYKDGADLLVVTAHNPGKRRRSVTVAASI